MFSICGGIISATRVDGRGWRHAAVFGLPGDMKTALAGLPRFLTAERTILATLQRLGPTHWLPVHSYRALST
jgi:hypothetical protein